MISSFSVRQVQHGWVVEWWIKLGKVEEVFVDRVVMNARLEELTADMEDE